MSDFAAFCQVSRRQVFARLDGRSEASASRGIKTVSLQIHTDSRPEPVDDRQKALLKKIKGRCRLIVRATFYRDVARSGRHHQSWQDRLKNQGAAASGSDDKAVLPWSNDSRNESKSLGPQSRAFDFPSSYFGRSENCRKVLPKQTWPFPLRPDVFNAERFSGCERQAEGRA
jgi:hypothetical protein